MTPERLAELRKLISTGRVGLKPETAKEVFAHIRDLEAQLAAARDLIRGITDTLEPYEGRLRVRGGWAEEFWGCIAEAEEYTRATATQPSEVDGFGDLIGSTPSLPWPRWDATPPSPEVK